MTVSKTYRANGKRECLRRVRQWEKIICRRYNVPFNSEPTLEGEA